MNANRSIPNTTVIPVLSYDDVPSAVEWLCRAFGFREHLRIGDHRVQLLVGDDGAVVARDGGGTPGGHSVMIRVEDVDRHHEQASAAGATITNPPTDYPYGERQYTVRDPAGHVWTFTQSIADVDPSDWGGVLFE